MYQHFVGDIKTKQKKKLDIKQLINWMGAATETAAAPNPKPFTKPIWHNIFQCCGYM